MKGTESKLVKYMSGSDKRFVIPVYQRNYDWKLENCKQLYNDLVKLIKNHRTSHFFGSIVSVYDFEGVNEEYLIIDGQQRLTTISLQKYYELLKKVKEGKDELKIDEQVKKSMPDFPKFAITYSISENEEDSTVNQDMMKEALVDYNGMFGTSFRVEGIGAYNSNLNDRLARKEKKYLEREEQLDLVIVVDRLLTGFDAPCLSTLFMDRQPMSPQDIIQAFSRTNRLHDPGKQYGQVVTFQAPSEFKNAINFALKLYSRGGDGVPIAEDWDTVRKSFGISVKAIKSLGETPEEIKALSKKQKKAFIKLFRSLDHDLAHLKAFSNYKESVLGEYGFTEEQYDNYAAMYKNVMEELKPEPPEPGEDPVVDDYDLIAYNKLRIDFEYIIELLQGMVESLDQSEDDFKEVNFEQNIRIIRELVGEFSQQNPKLSELLTTVIDEMAADREKYVGQDVSVIINQMRYEAIDKELKLYANKWFIALEDVRFEAYNYTDGELANENNLKEKADYTAYKESTTDPMPKFKFRKLMIEDFKEILMPEILPLLK